MSQHEAKHSKITPIRLYEDHDQELSYIAFGYGQEDIPGKLGNDWQGHFDGYLQHVHEIEAEKKPRWILGGGVWQIDQYNIRQKQMRELARLCMNAANPSGAAVVFIDNRDSRPRFDDEYAGDLIGWLEGKSFWAQWNHKKPLPRYNDAQWTIEQAEQAGVGRHTIRD